MKTYPREILWAILKPLGGAKLVRFEESRCTFQFALPVIKLAVEIDSGLIARFKWAKYNRANILGWHILRFTDHEIRCGIAKEMIGKFIVSAI